MLFQHLRGASKEIAKQRDLAQEGDPRVPLRLIRSDDASDEKRLAILNYDRRLRRRFEERCGAGATKVGLIYGKIFGFDIQRDQSLLVHMGLDPHDDSDIFLLERPKDTR